MSKKCILSVDRKMSIKIMKIKFMAMCQFEWSTIDGGSLASNSSIKCDNLYNVGESLSQME